MDVAGLAVLRTPEGAHAIEVAEGLVDGGPLAAAEALRARGFEASLAAAALTQVELRRRAAGKFGADASRMLFTRTGLEQATRAEVAARRAARLREAGVTRMADLGCGIGSDAIAAARAGIVVDAVEADPLTAAIAAANAAVFGAAATATAATTGLSSTTATAATTGLSSTTATAATSGLSSTTATAATTGVSAVGASTGRIIVAVGRAEDADLSQVEAAFCDPARRGVKGRVFDPEAYSPSWTFIRHLVATVPRTVLKLAPGIDHVLIPPGAEAEWVSIDGDVVEATFWCGPLAQVDRRATVICHGVAHELTGGPSAGGSGQAPAGPIGAFVYDPDGAVTRSHLVAAFTQVVGGRLGDPEIAYVYADAYTPTPFARAYAIREVLPFSLKRLRAALRAGDVGRLTIKKRGSALVPEQLRRDLHLRGAREATVLLTRLAGAPTAILCDPITETETAICATRSPRPLSRPRPEPPAPESSDPAAARRRSHPV